MKHFKTKALTIATAVTLGVGIAGSAQAGAKAFSNLNASLAIFHSSGAQYDFGDFSSLSVQNSSTDNAALNGVNDAHTAGPSAGNVDVQQAVVGTGAPGENVFTQQAPFGGYFSRGDAILQGAIITGTPVGTPATANQVSEVELNSNGNGLASSVIQNGSQFVFSLAQADSIRFDLAASGLAEAALTADSQSPPSQSTAGFNFGLELRNLDAGNSLVFAFSPAPVNNQTITTSTPGDVATITLPESFFTGATGPLDPNTRYSLSIISNTATSAEVRQVTVPEPASLALLGAGLLGMWATRRHPTA
jgi:hypothetical protein